MARRRLVRRATDMLALTLVCGLLGLVAAGVLAGYRTFVVQSGSMGAAAPVGSVVLTRPAPAAEIGVGDMIIVQRAGATPLLHRVVERTERSGQVEVRTKGDMNARTDRGSYALPAQTPRYEGVAVPRLGYALATLRTPRGWVAVAALAAALVAGAWLRRYWRSREQAEP